MPLADSIDREYIYNKKFTPRPILGKSVSPKFEYQRCNGIHINIADREKASPLLIVIHIIDIVHKMHPDIFKFNSGSFIDKLYGSNTLRKTILSNENIEFCTKFTTKT